MTEAVPDRRTAGFFAATQRIKADRIDERKSEVEVVSRYIVRTTASFG